jgi:hypothetical protein
MKIYNEIVETMIQQNLQNGLAEKKDTTRIPETTLFVDQLHSRIITAAAYHLEKPEGRQMYLRKLEPLLQQSIQSITSMESIILPLFVQCLNSPMIQTEMSKQIVKPETKLDEFMANLTKNINALSESNNPIEKIYKDLKASKVNPSIIEKKRIKDENPPPTGGNIRKSRNRKYSPKKKNRTKKR